MDTNNGDAHYVALFSALVGELRTRRKQLLVMQLAEILAKRASVEVSQNSTADEMVQIAAQLVRNISSPASVESVVRKAMPKPVSPHDNQEIEAAKKAIRLKFESYRAVNPGTNWHALFAQKMIRQYTCIGEERIIEEWALVWEIEARLVMSATPLSTRFRPPPPILTPP
jgi:hypothetical protein